MPYLLANQRFNYLFTYEIHEKLNIPAQYIPCSLYTTSQRLLYQYGASEITIAAVVTAISGLWKNITLKCGQTTDGLKCI